MPGWSLQTTAITNASGKNLFALTNATGSGKVIRLYRLWVTSPQTATVVGNIYFLRAGRATAVATGGTAMPFVSLANATLAGANTPFTGISAVSGATTITATMGTEFARIARCSDEISVGSLNIDELQNIMCFAAIWDSGYGDANVEPFVIRPNESFLLASDTIGNPGVGAVDIMAELTIEDT